MKYLSTKTYGNERGFSCCFRQHAATHSHCSLLHGYSLGFKFTFGANVLDEKNWVWDFGNCKFIKRFLEDTFDHTLAIAKDDPYLNELSKLDYLQLCKLVVLDGVGCEKFAQYVYTSIEPEIREQSNGRVKLLEVEVFEHGANSAIYRGYHE